jgi:ABC-2 type transport system ATP-binding protein
LQDVARITGRIVQLPAPNAQVVEDILAQVRAVGGVAEQVEIRPADLEDVFLAVMENQS